jgi:YggT family protein
MFLETFVVLLFRILQFAVLIRIVLSWISPMGAQSNPIYAIVYQITEPILAPIRRYTTFGMIDFSPFVAMVGLQMLEGFLIRLLAGAR